MKKTSGVKYFQALLDGLVAVQRPESLAKQDDPTFTYEVDGKCYALAFWALKGTLYTELYKRVLGPARLSGCLKNGYPSWSFNITTLEKKYQNGNLSWIPVGTPHAKSSPAFIEFARSILEPGAPTPTANS